MLMYTRTGDCDLPGLYGIIPGQTSHDTAINILTTLSQKRQNIVGQIGFFAYGAQGNRYFVSANSFFSPSASETDLELLLADDMKTPVFTLGEFVDLGCQPTHVYRVNNDDLGSLILILTFGQDNRTVLRIDAYSSVSADSSVVWLFMTPEQESQYYVDSIRNYITAEDEISWLGYASVDDYWAEAPLR